MSRAPVRSSRTRDAESELGDAETAQRGCSRPRAGHRRCWRVGRGRQGATEEFAAATVALTEAEAARDLAKHAVDSYVPPITEVVADKHPGCYGIQNAQAQVVKAGNDRDKGALALTAVASKLGC